MKREREMIGIAFAAAAVLTIGAAWHRIAIATVQPQRPTAPLPNPDLPSFALPSFAQRFEINDNGAEWTVLATTNDDAVPAPITVETIAVTPALETKPVRAAAAPDVCERHNLRKQNYYKGGYRYWRCVKPASLNVRDRRVAARPTCDARKSRPSAACTTTSPASHSASVGLRTKR